MPLLCSPAMIPSATMLFLEQRDLLTDDREPWAEFYA